MIVKDFTMQAIRAVKRGTFEGVIHTAVEVTAQAKELCPVADYMGGNLKNSIQWVADGGQTGGGETTENLTTKPPNWRGDCRYSGLLWGISGIRYAENVRAAVS